jgi:hypothetical protein
VIARLLPATRDIVLARHAVEAIFRLPEPERGPLLRRALQSSFGRVRAIALRPVLAEGSVENDALAIRMAADPQSWVRLIASGYLNRRGIDTAAILANTLRADDTSSTTMRACLAGLAELGRADQLDLVRSFTRHPLARVQLAAYAAWFHLAPSHKDEIARTVLASPHRRVRKLAMQLVREREAFLDVATALPLIAAHDDVDMMLTFARREAWIWLELIVQLEPRSHRDPELRIRLMRDLIAWIDDASKMYTKPSAAQRALFERDEVRQALAALLSRQDPVWTRNLAFQLEQSA